MPIQITRDPNGKITKSNLTIIDTPSPIYTIPNELIVSSTNINKLTLDNVELNINGEQFNYLDLSTLGLATPNRAIVVDDNKDIDNINDISCSILNINNINIDVSNYSTDIVTDIEAITNLTPGIAKARKTLVLDENKSVTGVDKITTNSFSFNGSNLTYSLPNKINDINLNFLDFDEIDIPKRNFIKCIYCPSVKKFVLLSGDGLENGIFISENLTEGWNNATLPASNWYDMTYNSTHKTITIVGTAGVYISIDGIYWNQTSTLTNYKKIKYINCNSTIYLYDIYDLYSGTVSTSLLSYNVMYSEDGGYTWNIYINDKVLNILEITSQNMVILLKVSSTNKLAISRISPGYIGTLTDIILTYIPSYYKDSIYIEYNDSVYILQGYSVPSTVVFTMYRLYDFLDNYTFSNESLNSLPQGHSLYYNSKTHLIYLYNKFYSKLYISYDGKSFIENNLLSNVMLNNIFFYEDKEIFLVKSSNNFLEIDNKLYNTDSNYLYHNIYLDKSIYIESENKYYGYLNNKFYISDDDFIWTEKYVFNDITSINNLLYINHLNKLLITSEDNTTGTYVSTDLGTSWTLDTNYEYEKIKNGYYLPIKLKFITINNSNTIFYYSSDLLTWSSITNINNYYYNVYNNDVYLIYNGTSAYTIYYINLGAENPTLITATSYTKTNLDSFNAYQGYTVLCYAAYLTYAGVTNYYRMYKDATAFINFNTVNSYYPYYNKDLNIFYLNDGYYYNTSMIRIPEYKLDLSRLLPNPDLKWSNSKKIFYKNNGNVSVTFYQNPLIKSNYLANYIEPDHKRLLYTYNKIKNNDGNNNINYTLFLNKYISYGLNKNWKYSFNLGNSQNILIAKETSTANFIYKTTNIEKVDNLTNVANSQLLTVNGYDIYPLNSTVNYVYMVGNTTNSKFISMTCNNGTNTATVTVYSAASTSISDICFLSDQLILVATENKEDNAGKLLYSTTSRNSLNYSSTPVLGNWQSLAYSSNLKKIIAVGNGSNKIAMSSNGILWENVTYPSEIENVSFSKIIYSKFLSMFIAISNSGGKLMTSVDGISWIVYDIADNNWTELKSLESINTILACSSDGSNRILYSLDGIKWYNNIKLNNKEWNGIVEGNKNLYLLSGDSTDEIFVSNPIYNKVIDNDLISINMQNISYLSNNNYSLISSYSDHKFNISGDIIFKNSAYTDTIINNYNQFNYGANSSNYISVNFVTNNDNKISVNNRLLSLNGTEYNNIIDNKEHSDSLTNNKLLIQNRNKLVVNELSCLETNYSYFNDITPGIVKSNMPIILDENKDITNLTSIGCKKLILDNSNLTNENTNNVTSDNLSINSLYDFTISASNTSAYAQIWSKIYNKFLYIKWGTSNLFSSSDGLSWIEHTEQSFSFARTIIEIESINRVIVGCRYGQSYYSDDLINWIEVTLPNTNLNNYAYDIAYSPTLGVLVWVTYYFTSAQISVSNDNGESWTYPTSNPLSGYVNNVVWCSHLNKFFVSSSSTTNHLAESSDGYTWTVSTVFSGYQLPFIAYDSTAQRLMVSTSNKKLLYSNDAVTWTESESGDFLSYNISYGMKYIPELKSTLIYHYTNNLFLAITKNGGKNWIQVGTSDTNINYIYNATYSPTLDIILLSSSTNNLFITKSAMSSSSSSSTVNNNQIIDINNIKQVKPFYKEINRLKNDWYSYNTIPANNWVDIIYEPSLNITIAISNTGTNDRLIYSTDSGASWNIISSITDNNWSSICYSPSLELFCAISTSDTNNKIITSSDGITWSEIDSPENNSWNKICFSESLGLFCAVSSTGTNRIMTSSDGSSWNAIAAPANNEWNSVVYSEYLNLFCAISSTGDNRIMTSSNGSTWNLSTIPLNSWVDITYSEDDVIFCAVSNSTENKYIIISNDGINWKKINIIYNGNLNNCNYINDLGYFISFGPNSMLLSNDGYKWDIVSNIYNCNSVCANSYEAYIYGISDSIIYRTDILNIPYSNKLFYNLHSLNLSKGFYLAPTTNISMDVLQLGIDSAAKPETSTWLRTSDNRMKENIVDADIDICYNNIKNLDLKKYKWKDEYVSKKIAKDRNKLGWIAQEVEQIMPKSVTQENMYGFEDFRTLNTDQIICNLYGAVKKIISTINEREEKINKLSEFYNNVKKIVDTIEIEEE